MQYDQLTWHIHFLPFNISYRRFYQILVKLALCLLKTFKLFKMLYDGRCFKVTQRTIIHFLRFFCRYNQDSFYVLTYYSLRYFKIWNFFNQVFYKFRDVFFVVLFKNTINPKTGSTILLFQLGWVFLFCSGSAVICCGRSFLSDSSALIVLSSLFASFYKYSLIPPWKFSCVLLLTSNEFFNSLNFLSKYSFSVIDHFLFLISCYHK